MSPTEPQLLEESLRHLIRRVMPGEEARDVECFKGEGDHCVCCLVREALAPVVGPQVKSQFKNTSFLRVRPESDTSHRIVIFKQE
jgi:hypothetical protein